MYWEEFLNAGGRGNRAPKKMVTVVEVKYVVE